MTIEYLISFVFALGLTVAYFILVKNKGVMKMVDKLK